MSEIQILINAIAASLAYSLGAYTKKTQKEPFDEQKLFLTVLVGFAVGLYSYFTQTTLDAATQFLTSVGAVTLLENYGKTIYRKIKAWLETKSETPSSA